MHAPRDGHAQVQQVLDLGVQRVRPDDQHYAGAAALPPTPAPAAPRRGPLLRPVPELADARPERPEVHGLGALGRPRREGRLLHPPPRHQNRVGRGPRLPAPPWDEVVDPQLSDSGEEALEALGEDRLARP